MRWGFVEGLLLRDGDAVLRSTPAGWMHWRTAATGAKRLATMAINALGEDATAAALVDWLNKADPAPIPKGGTWTRCAGCGHDVPPKATRCEACGADLTQSEPQKETR